jgi:hypothetical protein
LYRECAFRIVAGTTNRIDLPTVNMRSQRGDRPVLHDRTRRLRTVDSALFSMPWPDFDTVRYGKIAG